MAFGEERRERSERVPRDGVGTASPGGRRTSVTILVPALNEEDGISHVLSEIFQETRWPEGFEPHVLVVDGHSEDATRKVAQAAGATVVVQEGRGKGGAVRTGLRHSRGEYVVMLDADHSYPARRIPEFLERLQAGADVVIGSRTRGQIEDGAMTPLNELGNRMLSALASAIYRHPVSDVCSGMWAFGPRARALALNSVGFEVEAEMFARSVRGGLRIEEVPIEYRRRKGEPKLRSVAHGLRIAAKLLRTRFVREPGAGDGSEGRKG